MAETIARAGVETVPGVPFKLSWGAIFGGTFVALGVWVLLYALGLALGLTSVDPQRPSTAQAAGLGTGIWSLIAPLIALFVGGFTAARVAGVVDKGGGALHGAVLWGFTTVAGILLMGMALSMLLGSVFTLGRAMVGATGQAVSEALPPGAQAQEVARELGLSARDVLAPVNEQLRQEGLPPVTAGQLEAVLQDVANAVLREGQLDRALLVGAVSRNTELSGEQAQLLASRLEAQWSQVQARLAQLPRQLEQGALQAAETTGRVFWGVFFALLLGLISSVLGATLGVSRRQRYYAGGAVAPPVGPRREVYP